MFKKTLTVLIAVCMIMALTTLVSADTSEWEGGISDLREVSFCGAIIGVREAGLEVGSSYTIEYTIQAWSTTGFRVRYCDDGAPDSDFNFNDDNGDPKAHSSPAATASGTVASQVPALFSEGTLSENSIGVLTVNFTLGADIPDLIPVSTNYIGLFGIFGGDDYDVLGVVLKDGSGNVMASRGEPQGGAAAPAPAPVPAAPAEAGNTTPAATGTAQKDGADTGVAGVATVIGVALAATAGVVVSVRKRK